MERDFLKKRFEDLLRQSYESNSYRFTQFLSAIDAAIAYEVADEESVKLWGGTEGAERVMIRFGDVRELGYEVDFPINVLKVSPLNPKFCEELSHRDYLGTLMNLGIERDTIGDIVVKGKEAYIFCAERIAAFIMENVDRIKHTTVRCTQCNLSQSGQTGEGEMIDAAPSLEARRLVISSVRIDTIIARIYSLSRSEARNLFTAGLVLRNGRSCGSESLEPKEGDVFSVRGYGKFVFREKFRETKKGNAVVSVEMYV